MIRPCNEFESACVSKDRCPFCDKKGMVESGNSPEFPDYFTHVDCLKCGAVFVYTEEGIKLVREKQERPKRSWWSWLLWGPFVIFAFLYIVLLILRDLLEWVLGKTSKVGEWFDYRLGR